MSCFCWQWSLRTHFIGLCQEVATKEADTYSMLRSQWAPHWVQPNGYNRLVLFRSSISTQASLKAWASSWCIEQRVQDALGLCQVCLVVTELLWCCTQVAFDCTVRGLTTILWLTPTWLVSRSQARLCVGMLVLLVILSCGDMQITHFTRPVPLSSIIQQRPQLVSKKNSMMMRHQFKIACLQLHLPSSYCKASWQRNTADLWDLPHIGMTLQDGLSMTAWCSKAYLAYARARLQPLRMLWDPFRLEVGLVLSFVVVVAWQGAFELCRSER